MESLWLWLSLFFPLALESVRVGIEVCQVDSLNTLCDGKATTSTAFPFQCIWHSAWQPYEVLSPLDPWYLENKTNQSMLVNKDYLICFPIAWWLCCQTVRSHVWKLFLTNMYFIEGISKQSGDLMSENISETISRQINLKIYNWLQSHHCSAAGTWRYLHWNLLFSTQHF